MSSRMVMASGGVSRRLTNPGRQRRAPSLYAKKGNLWLFQLGTENSSFICNPSEIDRGYIVPESAQSIHFS